MKPASNVSENVVFLFPAHGSEHTGMCHDLYVHFPRFRERFDYCAEYLLDDMDTDLRQLIAPPRGQQQRIREKINQTYVVQPALFALEY